MTSWRSTGGARTPTNTVIAKLILHFASIDHARKLSLYICGTKTACLVEDGGAIRTESRGLASPAPASFLKRLFVQSEAEPRNFREVPRVLHLAGIYFNLKYS